MNDNKEVDAIILGGSYAGLSAAMALGRSLRTVLVIDSGLPCNRQTPYSHNFLSRDGEKPAEIAKSAKAQVLAYPTVSYLEELAVEGRKTDTGFVISTKSGQSFTSKKLIVATGIKDLFPDIKGFAACWGISVIHCPYCHGYEFRHRKTGILAPAERAFHLASLVNNLTDDLTILTTRKADFDGEQLAKLEQHHIKFLETPIAEVEHENGQINNLLFEDGNKMAFDAVYAAVPFEQHSDIPESLGCELTEQGHIKVDGFQKTNIHGVFACGDNSSMMRSVATAVSSGNLAGAMVNKELTDEQF